jgi:hypothetical protein
MYIHVYPQVPFFPLVWCFDEVHVLRWKLHILSIHSAISAICKLWRANLARQWALPASQDVSGPVSASDSSASLSKLCSFISFCQESGHIYPIRERSAYRCLSDSEHSMYRVSRVIYLSLPDISRWEMVRNISTWGPHVITYYHYRWLIILLAKPRACAVAPALAALCDNAPGAAPKLPPGCECLSENLDTDSVVPNHGCNGCRVNPFYALKNWGEKNRRWGGTGTVRTCDMVQMWHMWHWKYWKYWKWNPRQHYTVSTQYTDLMSWDQGHQLSMMLMQRRVKCGDHVVPAIRVGSLR